MLRDPDRVEPVDEVPPWQPPVRAPALESHERLTAQTAVTVSQIHTVESELMIRAMIEAAKSDGAIDVEARRRILTCLKDAGAIEPDRQALLAAMTAPPDMDGVVQRATSPGLAAEAYAASLLAIHDNTPREQRYLARLAERLALPPDTVRDMHARFDDPPPVAPSD
jgi:uncharacterized membrane protein YebE (DUF533 family)